MLIMQNKVGCKWSFEMKRRKLTETRHFPRRPTVVASPTNLRSTLVSVSFGYDVLW